MLVELLKPAGPELARRWLAALLLAPEEERPALVDAIEARMVETYASSASKPLLHVSEPPTQKDGYIEQVVRSYESADEPVEVTTSGRKRRQSG